MISAPRLLALAGASRPAPPAPTLCAAAERPVLSCPVVRTGFGADGRDAPAFTQGLTVLSAGRVVSHRRCSADSGGMDGRATARPPHGAFVEHRGARRFAEQIRGYLAGPGA